MNAKLPHWAVLAAMTLLLHCASGKPAVRFCARGNCTNGMGLFDQTRYDGCTSEGEFRNGAVWGFNTMRCRDGKSYAGQWVAGRAEGPGSFTDAQGTTYKGFFRGNQLCHVGDCRAGAGAYIIINGSYYRGTFKDGLPDGEGESFNANQRELYKGGFRRGRRYGWGVSKGRDTAYVGEFINDSHAGEGTLFDRDGRILVTGVWRGSICLDGCRRAKRTGTPSEMTRFRWTPSIVLSGNFEQDRRRFATRLIHAFPGVERLGPNRHESPPAGTTEVQFPSGQYRLRAWLSSIPSDGKRHAAVVYLHGGFAWEREDWEAAGRFARAGFVTMLPARRGDNANPGIIELFYGEVDDAIAAGEFLRRDERIDKDRIYLVGHSTGGTNALLVATRIAIFGKSRETISRLCPHPSTKPSQLSVPPGRNAETVA